MGFHFSLGDNFAVGCQGLIPLVLNILHKNVRKKKVCVYNVTIFYIRNRNKNFSLKFY